MDEFMMDDCMLTKVKRLMYETVELHVNAFNHRTATPHSNAAQQRCTAAACAHHFTMANRQT